MAEFKKGRYPVYLRKSRADIDKEQYGKYETLAKHEAEIRDYMAHNGYPIVEDDIFRELVSGESVSERTEFQKLMDLVARRECDGVVVRKIDRLGRGDMMEYGWILSTFQYTGTLIITPDRIYDPRRPEDMQMLQMLMLFSNTELVTYKGRLRDGKEQSVKSGQFIGSLAPFGYDKAIVNRMKTLTKNDDAKVVERIFDMVASGKTTVQVSQHLNESGYRTSAGNIWRPKAISYIVRNEVYKGCIRWNVWTTEIDSREGLAYKKKRRKSDNYICVDGLHEAIVSTEQWALANANIREAPKTKTSTELKNPLAGILRCAKCGKSMATWRVDRPNGRHYEYYRHPIYTDCEAQKCVRFDDLIGLVVDALQQCIDDARIEIESGSPASMVEGEIAALKREVAKVERRASRLVDLYMDEGITKQVYDERKSLLDAQLSSISARIAEREAEAAKTPQEVSLMASEAIGILLDADGNAEAKNTALKQLIKRIDYDNLPKGESGSSVKLTIHLF